MLFVPALVPFVFPLQGGTMIQEFPSKFFPTASGISDRVTRRTTTIGMVSVKGLYGLMIDFCTNPSPPSISERGRVDETRETHDRLVGG